MIKYYYVCPECGKEIEVVKKDLVKKEIKKNKYLEQPQIFYENDYAFILLKYKDKKYKILFDIEDIEKIKKLRCLLQNSGRNGKMHLQVRVFDREKHKLFLMSRYLLGMLEFNKKDIVDHINRNTLDNRKENLRVVSYWQNNQNKLHPNQISGIYYIKERNQYLAEICFNNKRHKLGFYDEFKEAVAARLAAEQIYLNFA